MMDLRKRRQSSSLCICIVGDALLTLSSTVCTGTSPADVISPPGVLENSRVFECMSAVG